MTAPVKKVKVEILRSVAGNANPQYDLPDHGYGPGDIVELHPELASKWIASGIARGMDKTERREELERLREEVELLELKELRDKLKALSQRPQSGQPILWPKKTERELAFYIADLYDEAKRIRDEGAPLPEHIPSEIREAENKDEAILRYAARFYVIKDGKRKPVNPRSLLNSYHEKLRETSPTSFPARDGTLRKL